MERDNQRYFVQMIELPESNIYRKRLKKRRKRTHQRIAFLSWWLGTVVLTIFPSLATALIAYIKGIPVDIVFLFGDGELILASFIIVISTLISCYQIQTQKLFLVYGLYHLMMFIAFFQLIAYAAIKTGSSNSATIVCTTSFFSLITSISISWVWTYTIGKR